MRNSVTGMCLLAITYRGLEGWGSTGAQANGGEPPEDAPQAISIHCSVRGRCSGSVWRRAMHSRP